MAALPLNTAPHLFSFTDFAILLIFIAHCIQKTVSIIFKDFLWLSRRFFSKFKDNSRTNCTFFKNSRSFPGPRSFSRTFQGLVKIGTDRSKQTVQIQIRLLHWLFAIPLDMLLQCITKLFPFLDNFDYYFGVPIFWICIGSTILTA